MSFELELALAHLQQVGSGADPGEASVVDDRDVLDLLVDHHSQHRLRAVARGHGDDVAAGVVEQR